MGFQRAVLGKKIRRVLLIYPPVNVSVQSIMCGDLPLGIAYLAAFMRNSAEVSVLDAAILGYNRKERVSKGFIRYGLSFDEIEKRIAQIQPDLVGISCIFSSQFQNALEVARRAKKIDPEIITITGGVHPSFLSRECLEQQAFDFIARGEGEFTLRELCEAISKGQGPETVPGLAWQEGGEYKESAARPPYKDLDEIPFPARDLFPVKEYDRISQPMGMVFKRRPFMSLITSRGCPYRCTFCSSTNFWGNKYRTRSPTNVLDEMEELMHKFGMREFKFFDDNLTANPQRAKKIFQGMIDRNLDVTWNTPNGVHVAHIDEEMLELMKRSGCYELTLAVESGDPDVLRDIIHKPTDLDQIRTAAKLMRKKGIGTYGFFVIGFPGETRQQIQNTLDFASSVDIDRISCFVANPLPGTEILKVCQEKGYVKEDYNFANIDYYEFKLNTPEWTGEEISRMRRKWFWKHNLTQLVRHPGRFASRYLSVLSRPRMLLGIIKSAARGR